MTVSLFLQIFLTSEVLLRHDLVLLLFCFRPTMLEIAYVAFIEALY